jgi:hypothetical protein
MSMIAQQSEIESLLEQIKAGGDATISGLRSLIRVAMRVRQHWMPRGTIEDAASVSDLLPSVEVETQTRAERTIIDCLDRTSREQEQVLLVNALSQWGGEHSANFLSDQVLAGKFSEEVVNQSLVAFGILGGSHSVTALAFTMMQSDERLATNADRNLSELADGGSEDLQVSSLPYSVPTVTRILRAVKFAAIPIGKDLEFSRGLFRFAAFMERRCERPEDFWPTFTSFLRNEKCDDLRTEEISSAGDDEVFDEKLRDQPIDHAPITRVIRDALSGLGQYSGNVFQNSETAALKSVEAIRCIAITTSDAAVLGQLVARSEHVQIAGATYLGLVRSGLFGKDYEAYILNKLTTEPTHRLLSSLEYGVRCGNSSVSAYLNVAHRQGSLLEKLND